MEELEIGSEEEEPAIMKPKTVSPFVKRIATTARSTKQAEMPFWVHDEVRLDIINTGNTAGGKEAGVAGCLR